jgi:hypothetical protein
MLAIKATNAAVNWLAKERSQYLLGVQKGYIANVNLDSIRKFL